MSTFGKPRVTSDRTFSDFIRNASAEERNALYADVMDRVAERQQAVIDKARAIQAEKTPSALSHRSE